VVFLIRLTDTCKTIPSPLQINNFNFDASLSRRQPVATGFNRLFIQEIHCFRAIQSGLIMKAATCPLNQMIPRADSGFLVWIAFGGGNFWVGRILNL